jgi:branched-chain amino acid transport system permease protein
MVREFVQYLISGLTVGAIYALSGLGFSIIYNGCGVINFAQGEFIMIGSMGTATLAASGVPLPLAVLGGMVAATVAGALIARVVIGRSQDTSHVSLIIVTVGASIFLRGVAEVAWDKDIHRLGAFSGEAPVPVLGAALLPQSLWVLGAALALIALTAFFFTRTMAGKAMLATSYNRLAAQLVGINPRLVTLGAFSLAAVLGAVGGAVATPITFASSEMGVMLGLKGFSAAMLGGLGSGPGAVAGGLIVGIAEALTAGYLSSAYKDAVAFVIIILVLVFQPNGLFGWRGAERV